MKGSELKNGALHINVQESEGGACHLETTTVPANP